MFCVFQINVKEIPKKEEFSENEISKKIEKLMKPFTQMQKNVQEAESENAQSNFGRPETRIGGLMRFGKSLYKMGMNDMEVGWWMSIFLTRPKGSFLSRPKAPLEKIHIGADEMMTIYKFFSKTFAILKNNPKILASLKKSEKEKWNALTKSLVRYQKENGGASALSWLMEKLGEYDQTEIYEGAGFGGVSRNDEEKAIYNILIDEFGKIIGSRSDARQFLAVLAEN